MGEVVLRCTTCRKEITLVTRRNEAPCFDPDCDGRMHPIDGGDDD